MKESNFYCKLTENVQKKLGKSWTAELLTDVVRNNETRHIALLLYQDGDELRPRICLEHFFEEYQGGKTMKDIVHEVLETYENAMQNISLDSFSGIEDWERVQGRLALRLISKERNRKALENYISIDFCDMAAIVTFYAEISEQGIKSIRVSHDLARRWHVPEAEILKTAEENTASLFPPREEEILDSLCRLAGISKQKVMQEIEVPPNLTVLSNCFGINGATVLLYDSFLRSVYERLGGKIVILPSSIHEVLVMPLASVPSLSYCEKIVKYINRRFVKEEEVLSDNIYLYDGEKVVPACGQNGGNNEKNDCPN